MGNKNNSLIFNLDVGIKFIMMLVIIISVFLTEKILSFVVIFILITCITIFSKIKKNFVLKNILSFGMIFIFPYAFGYGVTYLLMLFGISHFQNINVSNSLARIGKFILTAYISNLYLYTTQIECIASMFDTLFKPLKRFSIPISEYMLILIISIDEISEMTGIYRIIILERIKIIKNGKKDIKIILKDITDILVNSIVESFGKIGKIQERLKENIVLDKYKLNLSMNDFKGIIFCVIFIVLIVITEYESFYI
jgi:energy-coupling factor transport system permease protein